jgi:hypothetical protein
VIRVIIFTIRYSSEGQTSKRSLAAEDKNGIRVLYGEAVASTPQSPTEPRTGHRAVNGSNRIKPDFVYWILFFVLALLW